MKLNEETYIGDGVYASFDGFQVCLRTPRSSDDDGTYNDEIFLDDATLGNFLEWVARLRGERNVGAI